MHDHRWNYRVEMIKTGTFKKQEEKNQEITDRLNRLGMEGWDLVSIQPGPTGVPNYYFKRKF